MNQSGAALRLTLSVYGLKQYKRFRWTSRYHDDDAVSLELEHLHKKKTAPLKEHEGAKNGRFPDNMHLWVDCPLP
jgi:hypothetical protein